MQLSTYIKDLLYRYECVIIPGFGAFLTQYRPATIDTDSDTFYPPSKVVGFNGQLQTNDGLLANHVAAVENCSYELALQRIRNLTKEWTTSLLKGDQVELDRIGSFSYQANDRVRFEPAGLENFDRNAFGLCQFVATRLDRATNTEVVAPEPPVIKLEPTDRWKAVFKYAAVGLLAITLGGVGGLKVYEGQVEQYNLVEKQKADQRIENQIEAASFVIDNPLPALELTLPKTSGNYHVIAGAFRVEENAYKKIDQLRDQGYKARHIGVNRYGLHQVVYQSFESRTDAVSMLRQVQRSDNPDAWLFVQQLDQ